MKTRFDMDDIYPQLTRVETTLGSNGYPSNLQYAYYCDSKKEMREIIEEIRGDGHNVIELFIRKKNGWQLWNRDEQDHSMINLDYVKDSNWTLSINMNNSVDEIKSDIYSSLIGDDEEYIEELGVDRCVEIVENFYNDIKGYIGRGDIVIFYTPEQDNGIDYVITDDCTGYHDGDVTTYQMAFSVEEV